jgi:hypothetical protein
MRYVPLADLAAQMFSGASGAILRKRLFRGHMKLVRMSADCRQLYVRANGPRRWSPVKDWLTTRVGTKCWYTEAELIGAPLSIDHFRPVCDYWWLAFAAANYRVACAFANSPKHNELYGRAGGKQDNFPLVEPAQRATGWKKLRAERPILLDPCVERDCNLLAFQTDGRPVLNPAYALDPIAARRVDESKILLNLDHPDFNSKREQLCNEIADDVQTYEDLPAAAASRQIIVARLEGRLAAQAPFSSAARYYIRLHRDHDWVEALLNRVA